MRTIYERLGAGEPDSIPEMYRSRTKSSSGAFDSPEVASIPIETDDSSVRTILAIVLTGADAEVQEGEVWDLYAEAECVNSTSKRVFWWSEIRAHSNDGHNRGGTQVMVDNRSWGIIPTFRNRMTHRQTLYRWSAPLMGIDPLYIKLVTWVTADTSGDSVSVTSNRGHLGLIRYRGPVPVGSWVGLEARGADPRRTA